MKPVSALRLLRWIVLALVLTALGRASAQETHRLDLDQKRAALTATETALRDKNLDDAGLQTLRAQSDALSLELQGAIAELTPRLADSAKRLDELTPKSGQPAPTTDVAAKDLETEKQRHDRLDANLRAARAMVLEANDVSTRISAARRQLFAERTFARSSSVLNPQLWTAVGRELPIEAAVVRNLTDNWVGAIGEPLQHHVTIDFASYLVDVFAQLLHRMNADQCKTLRFAQVRAGLPATVPEVLVQMLCSAFVVTLCRTVIALCRRHIWSV